MSSSQVNGGIPIDYVPPPPPPITGTLFSNNNHNHNTTTSHHHSEPEPDHATAGLPLPPSVATAVSTPSWSTISCENPSAAPCQRSLHAGAVHQDSLYVFGGYDGTTRVNDFIEFDFQKKRWRPVLAVGSVPTPRDRHTACVYNHSLYVFGGFDGTSRVNDFTGFDFNEGRWSHVPIAHGFAPSPRHSHAAVVYRHSMYCFGGYDGGYRNDFHSFHFGTLTWSVVPSSGRIPRARYRASLNVFEKSCILFGGHDGAKHLNDVHVFQFETSVWSSLEIQDPHPPPIPRDSHVAIVHGSSMFIFGGSTGNAMNDFYQLDLKRHSWIPLSQNGTFVKILFVEDFVDHHCEDLKAQLDLQSSIGDESAPGRRFCHIGVIYKSHFVIFGGYDGSNRLNDFQHHYVGENARQSEVDIPESHLVMDMKNLVNAPVLSDITFIVEDTPIYAHRILCIRCDYFKAMFAREDSASQFREAQTREVHMPDVRKSSFLSLLEYLYTDEIVWLRDTCQEDETEAFSVEQAMDCFVLADQVGVERLKKICEARMLSHLSVENAATIFHAADAHHALGLRDRCLNFILRHFDQVTKSKAFEEMGRTNVELVFEVLRGRR